MQIFKCIDDTDLVKFSIFPCTLCQYHCPYCYARKTKKWNTYIPKNKLDQILANLYKAPDCIITILGGEPTLYPFLNYFLERLFNIENVKHIEIFTNGVKKINSFNDKLHVFYSYHNLMCENSETFKQRILNEKNNKSMCIMCEGNKEKILDMLEFCKNNNIKAHLQYRYDNETLSKTSDFNFKQDKDIFQYNDKFLTLTDFYKNEISFKGWQCEMKNFLITEDGIIDECNQEHYLISDINKLKIVRRCNKDRCSLNGDFLLYNKKVLQ